MLFPSYVWIAYSRKYSAALGDSCSAAELAEFLDGVFTITPSAAATEDNFLAPTKEVS
jgi:hypothetical protein